MLAHLRNTMISVTHFHNLKTKTEIEGKPDSFRAIKC